LADMNVWPFFNLLNIVIGVLIGSFARSWLWMIGICFASGIGLNFVSDYLSYGRPLAHIRGAILDSFSFLIFGALIFGSRLYFRRQRKLLAEIETGKD